MIIIGVRKIDCIIEIDAGDWKRNEDSSYRPKFTLQ